MDSLTHLVAGALAPLAFRATPRRTAVLAFGIVVGELPDMDVFFGASVEALLVLHRGVTHALFWQPVLVLAAVIPFYLWLRCRPPSALPVPPLCRARGGAAGPPPPACESGADGQGDFGFFRMWLIALFAVGTHIYLDCMTTFGTQALLPFSGARIAFPAVFIVDPLLTLPALALLLSALRSGPEVVASRERGRPARAWSFFSARAARLARLALAWLLVYPLICLGVNQAATALLEPEFAARAARAGESAQDAPPRFGRPKLLLITEPFSPFRWKAVLDMGDVWRMGSLDLFSPRSAALDGVFPKAEPALYESLKRQAPVFAMFEDFAPLMTQAERPASFLERLHWSGPVTEYRFLDMRYIQSPDSAAHAVGRGDPHFVLEARVTEAGNLLAWRFLKRDSERDTPWVAVE